MTEERKGAYSRRDGGNKSNAGRDGQRTNGARPRMRVGRAVGSSERYTGNSNTREARPRTGYNAAYDERATYQSRNANRTLSGQSSSEDNTRYSDTRNSYSRTPYQREGGGQREGGYRAHNGDYKGRPKRVNTKWANNKKRVDYKEAQIDPDAPIRLNKYLSNAGICSRRDADRYIAAGVVTVNGNVVTELGAKVLRTDVVHFHDNPVNMEKKVYLLLNKPKGYVTTSDDPQNRKTVMDLVGKACPERIYPIGRLDRNTTGVLLFTNDGEMATKLTHPKFMKKKIYHVFLDKNVSVGDLRQLLEGIELEDGPIKADAIEYASLTDKKQVGIEIHSGRNRIVRRMFEHLGYKVTKLDRVYFAGVTKKNLKRGDWRFLTEEEVIALRMGAFE